MALEWSQVEAALQELFPGYAGYQEDDHWQPVQEDGYEVYEDLKKTINILCLTKTSFMKTKWNK